MRRPYGGLWGLVVLVLATCHLASGEIFLLENGGRVEGDLLNPDESPRASYRIKTSLGGQITLAASQVKEVIHRRPEQIQYEKTRHDYPDTVEAQWKLAEWCREHRLSSQRETHLRRILELDPDHEKARHALGYSQIGGRWMTREEFMIEQGYQWYKSRWRLPQEIELLKQQEAKDAAEGEWKRKLKLWRDWLATDRWREAQENIRRIDDPAAIKALAEALKDDGRDRARLLYIEALATIGTPGANRLLAAWTLVDPVEEVRLTCLDHLKEKKDPEVVAYFIGKLQSEDNTEVNRAAVALRHLGDPSAVRALIDALVTTHKYKIKTGDPGQISTTFSNAGPGGLSVGGGGTKVVTGQNRNRAVLEALVSLTGVNYDFNVAGWKSWYTSQLNRPHLDARRDD